MPIRHRFIVSALLVVVSTLVGVCCVKRPTEGAFSASAASAEPQPASKTHRSAGAPGDSIPIDTFHPAPAFRGYRLAHPDERHELPEILREVSGLTDISDTSVACVQDEQGTVFIYDLDRRAIESRVAFAGAGDYEGITRVDQTLFVLRSDGVLFEIANFASSSPGIRTHALGLPTRDNEGLCYDPLESRLLIAPKSRLGKSDEARQSQALFAFEPRIARFDPRPAVVLDLREVLDGREKVRETKRGRKRVLPSRFLPSSVTVHPSTGEYFVISAVAHNLAVFDRMGVLVEQQALDQDLFPQPEGITFLPSRELVIVNEGADGAPTLLRFKPSNFIVDR